MHGWCLDGKDVIEEMYGGGLIVDGEHKGIIERAELIDWTPTVCDLVGLSRYPKQNSGKSILRNYKLTDKK
jgi:arylsulfatase A-like enzyme